MPTRLPLAATGMAPTSSSRIFLGDGVDCGVGRNACDALMHHVSHFHRELLFTRWSTNKKLGCAGFDVASELPRMIFELAHRGIEGVADGDIDVLMRLVLRAFLIHMHVVARHADVDADLVELALVVMAMRRLDGDVAAHDALEEAVELGCFLADDRFDGRRGVHVPNADLQGYLYVVLLFDTQTNVPRGHEPVSISLITSSTPKTYQPSHPGS